MQVKIRLQRFGSKKKPYYRIVAAASSSPRDGKFLEILGLYHPISAEGQQYRLDKDKIMAWLDKGAQPSPQVQKILTANKMWQDFSLGREKRRVDASKKSRARRKTKKKATSAKAEPAAAEQATS